MASKGNTWCKKLMTKGKQYALKQKLGNEVGVMTMCAKAKNPMARSHRDTINDKPLPLPPKVTDKLPLPRIEGWKPKRFKRRGR